MGPRSRGRAPLRPAASNPLPAFGTPAPPEAVDSLPARQRYAPPLASGRRKGFLPVCRPKAGQPGSRPRQPAFRPRKGSGIGHVRRINRFSQENPKKFSIMREMRAPPNLVRNMLFVGDATSLKGTHFLACTPMGVISGPGAPVHNPRYGSKRVAVGFLVLQGKAVPSLFKGFLDDPYSGPPPRG